MAERIRPSAPTSKFPGLLVSNLVLYEEKLGKGADATVFAAEWNGTVCAAKRLHYILLEDESPGGADKFISNFEAECLTWSKLRHPAWSSSWRRLAAHTVPFHATANTVASDPLPNLSSVNTRFEMRSPGNLALEKDGRSLSAIFDTMFYHWNLVLQITW